MSALGDACRALAEPAAQFSYSAARPVLGSPDLDRVLAIPRRPPYARVGRKAATRKYATPNGRMWLRPIQALALEEAARCGGMLAPVGVGQGKTLITLLLPIALNATTTVLLVPPALREQLKKEYPEYREHFRLPNMHGLPITPGERRKIYVVSYSELSGPKANAKESVLDRLKPDLIVADECHSVAAVSAARTKRFLRYMKAHPNTKFCGLSGTITSKSIRNFSHLARLALGPNAPVPFAWPVLEEWAGALDSADWPAPPGELVRLCKPGEDVRSGFRRRLIETPGVVASAPDVLPISLYIRARQLVVPPSVEKALADLRGDWVTPGGEEITDALAFSRYARQIAAGLYYRWIWPRGESLPVREEWLDARKWWHREVREFLKGHASAGLDSPLLLAQAAARGAIHTENWPRWARARGTAKPDVEAVWISDYMVLDAVAWARENVGIVWFEHAALGAEIARVGGLPFYGAGDEAARGIMGENGKRSVVASRKAQGEGKNLQAFGDQLITTPNTSGKVWEQQIGRTHREGQQRDEVNASVYLHTSEMLAAMQTAKRDARYIQDTLGTPQRLLNATYL